MKKTIALFFKNPNELEEKLNETGIFEVTAKTDNGTDAIKLAEISKPDAVITDIVLKETDGLTLIEKLNAYETKIVVYSSFYSDEIIDSARKKGAALYLVKPLSPEIIINRLKDLLGINACCNETVGRLNKNGADYDMAELRISNVFLSIGISPHIKGYGFLRTGVKLAMDDPSVLGNITKELYPKIAENYLTSSSKVERSIRHAIEVAWNRGRIGNLNTIFGVNFYLDGDKPTNGEFIAFVADRLLQEKRMGKL